MNEKNKITIDIILRELNDIKEPLRHCALTLDSDDPELSEKIKDHIEIFKTICEQNP